MTDQTQLLIPTSSSPLATTLAAVGVARWLEALGQDVTGKVVDVRVADLGHAAVVSTPAHITPDLVQAKHYQQPLCSWILTAKNGPAPGDVSVIDYEDEKRRNGEYYVELEQLRKRGLTVRRLPQEEQAELEQRAPRPWWPVAASINQMSAITAYNKAIERWAQCRAAYPELVQIIWTMGSGTPDAIEQAQMQWSTLAKRHNLDKNPLLSATQVVNPEQGKGANRAKADKLDIGGQESFWLLEYFKFVGLYGAALPRTVQGRKDRKTYVVLPAQDGVALRWYGKSFSNFQKEFWPNSAVKMDILAALRYTAVILEDWQGAQRSSGRRRRPSDYVAGFAVASFKDLGSAVAVMNVSTINLPDWVGWPDDADEAQTLISVVDEHQRMIAALDEKKGEEDQLLRAYRDFLSSRDPALRAFFDFSLGYARHVMRQLSKRQQVRRLTLENLKEIVMAQEEQRHKKLQPVLESVGFQNIATAIRQSTVLQQIHGDNLYDVQYGLADELHRHSRNNGEFLRALALFLQKYSQENARVLEKMRKQGQHKYRKRISISTDDIAQVTALVDEYGAAMIAGLLTAYGYARDGRARTEQEPQGDDQADSDDAADDTQDAE